MYPRLCAGGFSLPSLYYLMLVLFILVFVPFIYPDNLFVQESSIDIKANGEVKAMAHHSSTLENPMDGGAW